MTPIQIEALFHRSPRLIPSGPEAKDFVFRVALPKALPPRYSVEPYVRLRDQLSIGSCVGNSIAFGCESIRNKSRPLDDRSDLSRELIYTLGKLEAGLLGQGDTGTTIRGGLDAARKWGVCAEVDLPYDQLGWDAMPEQRILDLAGPHKLSTFERITLNPDNYRDRIDALKQAVATGKRVIVGMYVPRGMFYIHGPRSDHAAQWNWTDPTMSQIQGAHAILLGGWDDSIYPPGLGSALLGNSWGPTWGDNGWTAIPWAGLTNFVFEAWTIDGFDGYSDTGPVVEPPLPDTEVAQHRAALCALGNATDAGDALTWVIDPTLQCYVSAYEYLRRRGLSHQRMAQVTGLSIAEIDGFAGNPGNASRLAAWTGF